MKPKQDDNYRGFVSIWGEEVLKYGFAQFPSLLIGNLKKFKIDPAELAVILYLYSKRFEKVIFIENFLAALPMCRNTLDRCFRTLESKGFLIRIVRPGHYSIYDLRGLCTAVKVYAKTGVIHHQNLKIKHLKNGATQSQQLVTSYKEELLEKDEVGSIWESVPQRIREAAERKRKGVIK